MQELLIFRVEPIDPPAGAGERVIVPYSPVFPALEGQLPQLDRGILDLAAQIALARLQGPDPRGALDDARGLVSGLRHAVLGSINHVDRPLKKIHGRP